MWRRKSAAGIGENRQPDTQLSLFGRTFDLPVFAAPIGAMKLHYGDLYDDAESQPEKMG